MQRHRTFSGFTLVELLVVIAIMAVLVSILLPALHRARYMARRAVCITNVRSQYLTFQLYAADNEGRFASHWDYTPQYVRSSASLAGRSTVRKAMDRYVEEPDILVCPVLRTWGAGYSDLDYIYNGYGAWLARDPYTNAGATEVSIPYFWFANYHSYMGQTPIFDFTARDGTHAHSRPWPTRTSECQEDKAFIAHVVYYHWGFDLTWDLSHGGQTGPVLGSALFDDATESQDNPVGFSDGHVIVRNRGEMRPRAYIETLNASGGQAYSPLEIYY